MPLRAPTADEVEYLRQQGVDIDALPAELNFSNETKNTIPSTIGKTLKAHAGSIVGGGAGALGTGAILTGLGLAPFTEGVSLVPSLLALTGIAGGAAAGSYAGQKGQEAVLPSEYNKRLQEEAAQAAEENPKTAAATDITAGAIASGGFPSAKIPALAARGVGKMLLTKGASEAEKAAMKNIAIQSAINPAIGAGLELAQTGNLPSLKLVAEQTAGGALFAGHNPLLGRAGYISPESNAEPTGEPNQKDNPPNPNPAIPENQGLTGQADSTAPTSKSQEPTRLDVTRDVPKVVTDVKPDPEKVAITELRPQQTASEVPIRNIPTTLNPDFEVSPRETVPIKQPVTSIPIPYAKSSPKEAIPIKGFELPKTEEPAAIPVEAAKVEEPPVAPTAPVEEAKPTSQEDLIAKLKAQGEADLKAKVAEQGGKIREANTKDLIGDVTPDNEVRSTAVPNSRAAMHVDHGYYSDYGWRYEAEKNRVWWNDKPTDEQKNAVTQFLEKKGISTEGLTHSSLYRMGEFYNQENQLQDYPKLSKFIPEEGVPLKDLLEHKQLQNDEYIRLLKSMNIDSDALKIPVKIGDKKDFSVYKPNENGKEVIYMHPEDNTAAFAHEVLHGAIAKKIPVEFEEHTGAAGKKVLDEYLKNGEDTNIKELIKAYYDTLNHLELNDVVFGKEGTYENAEKARGIGNVNYSLHNLHEFISNVFDQPNFRELLNKIPSSQAKGQTVWSRLVAAFRRFLGIDVKQGNILEQVLKNTESLASQPREGTEEGALERGANPKKKDEMDFLEGPFRSTIDKISDIDHPLASKLSDAAYKMLNTKDQLRGKLLNPVLQKGEHISAAQDKKLEDAMWADIHGKPVPYFRSKAEQDTWNAAKKSNDQWQDWRIHNAEPVRLNGKPVLPTKKDNAWIVSPNTDVINTLKEATDTTKINEYHKQYIDNEVNNFKVAPADAEENWNDFKKSVQGNMFTSGRAGSLEHFGQNRKLNVIPLPRSMAKSGFLKNFEAGYQRASTDMAFFKEIESNPDAMSALGQTVDPWLKKIPTSDNSLASNPSVKAFLKNVQGDLAGAGFHNEKALSNLATATMLGPLTEIHKVIASHIGPMDYISNPYQLSRFLGAAIKNRAEAYQNAVENGVVKMRASKLSDFLASDMTTADRWRTLAQTIRKVYTLNDLTNKFAITSMQAGWEGVLPTKIERANSGNKYEQSILRKIDPDYTVGKTYTPDEIPKLASNMVNRIQGTGDSRTMPDWMSGDSELSGFFKLSHWSLAQTNRFYQDLVEPAKKGNVVPLMRGIFGAAIGGYMIKKLREKLGAKKGQIPSLEEIASSTEGFGGNKMAIAYNMMAASTYAGLGGVLAMLGKAPLDAIFKNKPQGMIFPLDETVSDLAETVGKVTTAIANDPQLNWVELAQAIGGHLLSSNFQLGRVVYNQAIDNDLITGTQAEKKKLSDKLGQLRRFQMVEHLPYTEQDSGGQSYMNLEQKKFKMEPDIGKAAAQIPEMVQSIMEKYQGQPDVMMSKLKALKENTSSATMPSMEEQPIQFTKYMEYLEKLKGPDAANAELLSYMMKKMVNQAKSSAVP